MDIYNGFTEEQFYTIVKTELIKEPKYIELLNNNFQMFMETGVEEDDYDEDEAKFLAFGNTISIIIIEKIFGLNAYGNKLPFGFKEDAEIFAFEFYPDEELRNFFSENNWNFIINEIINIHTDNNPDDENIEFEIEIIYQSEIRNFRYYYVDGNLDSVLDIDTNTYTEDYPTFDIKECWSKYFEN